MSCHGAVHVSNTPGYSGLIFGPSYSSGAPTAASQSVAQSQHLLQQASHLHAMTGLVPTNYNRFLAEMAQQQAGSGPAPVPLFTRRNDVIDTSTITAQAHIVKVQPLQPSGLGWVSPMFGVAPLHTTPDLMLEAYNVNQRQRQQEQQLSQHHAYQQQLLRQVQHGQLQQQLEQLAQRQQHQQLAQRQQHQQQQPPQWVPVTTAAAIGAAEAERVDATGEAAAAGGSTDQQSSSEDYSSDVSSPRPRKRQAAQSTGAKKRARTTWLTEPQVILPIGNTQKPHIKKAGTSMYRGVTRHRHTGKWEAHLWDASVARKGKAGGSSGGRRRGKQIYLGGYGSEHDAARAFDRAALVYWGEEAQINFPITEYAADLDWMAGHSRDSIVQHLRRGSVGFARGASRYRGVTKHHQAGKWEARIGQVGGHRYMYLGTFNSQEEAAKAYDIAALRYRGIGKAVTNFSTTNYLVPGTTDQLLQYEEVMGAPAGSSTPPPAGSGSASGAATHVSGQGVAGSAKSGSRAASPASCHSPSWSAQDGVLAMQPSQQQQQQQQQQEEEAGAVSVGHSAVVGNDAAVDGVVDGQSVFQADELERQISCAHMASLLNDHSDMLLPLDDDWRVAEMMQM